MAGIRLTSFLLRTNGHTVRLSEMEYLGHQIMSTQGHPEQKLHSRQGLVARTNAHAALDQMLLKPLHIIRRYHLWCSPQPCCETLAGPQVTALRCRAEIARAHISNHAGAKGRRRSLRLGKRLDVHGKNPLLIEAKLPQHKGNSSQSPNRKSHAFSAISDQFAKYREAI